MRLIAIKMALVFGLGAVLLAFPGARAVAECPAWFSRVARIAAGVNDYRKASWAKYRQEIREQGKRRILIRERQRLPANASYFDHVVAFSMNPVAVGFNRPRQLTIPGSIVAALALLEAPTLVLEYYNTKEQLREMAGIVVDKELPGANYLWGLMLDGALEGAAGAKLALEHEAKLKRWSQGPYSTSVELARVKEMRRLGILPAASAANFDALMRRVYSESLRGFSGAPEAGKKFADTLFENFRAAIFKSPELAGRSDFEKEMLATAFWPLPTIGEHSDIFLQQKIFTAPDADVGMKRVRELLARREISPGDASRMAHSLTEEPRGTAKEAEKRVKEARTFLPESIASTLARPEIPRYARERTFDSKKLSSELDLWRLLYEDPRFLNLKEVVAAGEVSPGAALAYAESQRRALEELYQLNAENAGKKFDFPALDKLFAFSSGKPNSLLTEVKAGIENLMAAHPEAPAEHFLGCFAEVAEYWRDAFREEAEWARASRDPAVFAAKQAGKKESRSLAYAGILDRCIPKAQP